MITDFLLGECLHGKALISLGRSVSFIQVCDPCADLLRAERYEVFTPALRPEPLPALAA